MTDIDIADEMLAALKNWVEAEVIPHASEFELPDEYPTDMALQMADFGLFGATIPSEFGGLELDNMTYARVIEELSRGWMSLAGIINSHLICAKLISKFGSDEQKLKWLPSMATGELRGCFSLSEPDSGSDAGALRCRAERDGGDPPLVPFEGDDRWLIGVSGEERCTPHQDEAGHEFPQRFHSLKPAVQKSGRRSP